MFSKTPATNNLEWLQGYYLSLCNDEWEHGYGFKIGNLDNPGWTFVLDLTDTPMDGISFEAQVMERSEHDWFHCRLEGKSFQAYCGPLNLDEVISIFRARVETARSSEAAFD